MTGRCKVGGRGPPYDSGTTVVVILVAALFLSALTPAASGTTVPVVVTLLSQALDLPGSNGSQPIQFKVSNLSEGSSLSGATLEISTPSNPSQGPSGVLILSSTKETLWSWPTGFGWAGTQQGAWLTADNQTVQRGLSIPTESRIQAVQGTIGSTRGALSGNYSVQASVGDLKVFNRSGAETYTPLAPLGWGNSISGISSIAVGSEPNGTSLLALGESTGTLNLFLFYPGQAGQLVYTTVLSAPSSVTGLVLVTLPESPLLSVVAISGSYGYICQQNGLGTWETIVLPIPVGQGDVAPTATSLAFVHYETGQGVIVVGTTGSQLVAWNYSTFSGFQGTGRFLAALPWVPTSMTGYSQPGDAAQLIVGGSDQVSFYSLASQSVSLESTLTLSDQATVTTLAVNSSGNLVMIGDSEGALTPALGPPWTLGSSLSLGTDPVVGTAFANAPNGTVIADTANNTVFAAVDSGTSVSGLHFLGSVTSPYGAEPVAMGPIFGFGEEDLLVPTGGTLWASASTANFISTSMPGLLSNVTLALQNAPHSKASDGTEWSNVSVDLTSHGGSTTISSLLVVYAFDYNVSITSLVAAALKANTAVGRTVSITVNSATGGQVMISAQMTVLEPAPPSVWGSLVDFLGVDGLLAAIALAVAGGVLTALGVVRYHARARGVNAKIPNKATSIGGSQTPIAPQNFSSK